MSPAAKSAMQIEDRIDWLLDHWLEEKSYTTW
jgi:hypothetical protein